MVDDIAGRIRYWRERRGLSRRACAELAGYSEGWLKKIEQGQRRIDRLPVLDQLARVLRVPLAELLGEPASAGQRADAGVAELADDQEVHAVDVDVVMPVVLRHLRSEDDQVLRLFLGLQARLGGDDLYLPLARHAERLSASLQTRMSRQRLATLGRLLQMAGWLAIDSNRHRAARQHLAAALYVAHEVDDTALAASALAYMSLQQVYLHDHAKALSLARTAAETTHASVSPLVGAMLGTRLARAYARLGGRRECVAALDRAYGNLSKAGGSEEPVWITYVDEVEVSAQAGACYLDLGMTAEADQYLQTALALMKQQAPERTRDRVHYLSRLAKSSLLKGDLDQACAHADEALLHSETVGSARVLDRLHEVGEALAPFNNHQAAREIRARVTALRSSSPR